ncbi:MAG TPA: sugar-binding protein [Steroidobacteraceae bacterium]|jgi:endo-1,4-beta-xylanase|nr:sugar-binding protein [Steroidobacteraceae bacterium]
MHRGCFAAAALLGGAPVLANNVLEAQFTPTPVVVDGVVDAAWNGAEAATLANSYNPAMTGPAACPTSGKVRAMWDGAVLYVLVSVTDPLLSTAAALNFNRDGVEFWVDHFDDKVAKFQEDDGTFTVTAPPATFSANRPQNTIFDNVSSRYLKSYGSATSSNGYNVEIAWYLGEHHRANGAKFGFDFGINEADASGTRQCRVFWNPATRNRTTDDNREWGTVILAGYDGVAPMQVDTFMLAKNIAKANALARGIWKDETAIDKRLAIANGAMAVHSQRAVDRANVTLDHALRGLRRSGPYPDPHDLPAITHLPDPFRFFDGRRVKTAADWNRRREEIKALMQYYEFGMKPPRPSSLEASSVIDGESRNITVQMREAARTASFAARLTVPTAAQAAASGKSAPFPVIVSLDYAVNNGNANYLDAGYAVLSLPTAGVQSDNVAHTGAIFDLYPYDVAAGSDFGCLVGWAWGASRAVDALEFLLANDPGYVLEVNGVATPLLALDKLAVTGFSRWGKGALLTGMLDERFKVTHAGASGSGGAAPYRFVPFGNEYAWGSTSGSEVLGDHLRHQTHNSNEMMRRFLNERIYETKTHGYGERLPFDHHLEIAAIAPRAVLIANTNDDYGNNAEGDSLGYEAALPVFEYLGAADKLALDLYMGGGGHSLKQSQQHNFVRFLDHVLYGLPLPNTVPPGDASNTPTDVQLRRDPYLTGANGGQSVYAIYYGGFKAIMPWLKNVPAH